jgi:hypothetical protein
MRFILRAAFWLAVVGLFLPAVTRDGPQDSRNSVSATDAAVAAGAAVADMRSFCSRQPEACAVGSQVAVAIGEKAQAGAKALFDVVSETMSAADERSATRERSEGARASASQNTLTANDLAAEWRGPATRREASKRPAG